jgi:hypothetical protein
MPVNESNTIQYTVTTSRIADGTTLYWKTTGNTTNSDIVGGNTGSITINNNQATFNVTIASDSNTDGTKTLGINLLTGSLSGTSVVTTPTPIVINDTSQAPSFYVADYLAVGGGGGGSGAGNGIGNSNGTGGGGGGGAGGLLSGTTNLTVGQTYTITIGAGASYTGNFGVNGSNSIFGAITVIGGGGASYGYSGLFGQEAQPGGSGGGGGQSWADYRNITGGNGYNYPGPTQQGYPGGTGTNTSPGAARTWGGGGGGGGAGAAGSNAPGGYGPAWPGGTSGPGGGAGGNGYTWPITGSTYAGGGGGGGYNIAGPSSPPTVPLVASSGGTGGGGTGYQPTTPANGWVPGFVGNKDGQTNTGGGGGGQGNSPSNWGTGGGNGGSGVVIIAVPTPSYPGSAPGATVTTPPAAPGKTVLTFTSSGTYTA